MSYHSTDGNGAMLLCIDASEVDSSLVQVSSGGETLYELGDDECIEYSTDNDLTLWIQPPHAITLTDLQNLLDLEDYELIMDTRAAVDCEVWLGYSFTGDQITTLQEGEEDTFFNVYSMSAGRSIGYPTLTTVYVRCHSYLFDIEREFASSTQNYFNYNVSLEIMNEDDYYTMKFIGEEV